MLLEQKDHWAATLPHVFVVFCSQSIAVHMLSFSKAAGLCAALLACQQQDPSVEIPACQQHELSANASHLVWPVSCGEPLLELSAIQRSGAMCSVLTGLCTLTQEQSSVTPHHARQLGASEAADHTPGTEEWWFNIGAVAALVIVSGMMAGTCGFRPRYHSVQSSLVVNIVQVLPWALCQWTQHILKYCSALGQRCRNVRRRE
jgi:hypothetical protein